MATTGTQVNLPAPTIGALPVTLQPSGGDDWPALLAAMQQWAYKRPIQLAAGTWICKTAPTGAGIPSGTVLMMSPGVLINPQLSNSVADPRVAPFFANVVPADASIAAASTTIAAGSNGAALPQATINVASTAGFPTSGTFDVVIGGNAVTISYSGTTGTTFTGCSGGTGTLATSQVVRSNTTTVNTNVTVGSRTLIGNGNAIAVGSLLEVLNIAAPKGLRGGIYKITARSGSGPYTYTVDRPILFPIVSGDTVQVLASRPENILIFGNGARGSGTASRIHEMPGAYRCLFQDFSIDTSLGTLATDLAMSWDIGSHASVYRRIKVDGGGTALGGLAVESGDSCIIEDCETLNCTGGSPTGTAGIIIYDSANCEVRNPKSYGNTNGVAFVSDSLTTGCFGCAVIGGNVNGNTTTGIYVGYATTRTRLVGVNADYNPTGIEIDSATGTCSEVLITNCSATGCSSSGLTTTAATSGIKARNLDVSNGGGVGINLSSDFDVSGLIARGGNPTGAVYINTASQVRLADVDLQSSTNGWVAVTSVTSARVLLSGQVTLDGTSAFGVNCASSTIVARYVRMTGAGAASATAFQLQSSSRLLLGPGCDTTALNATLNVISGTASLQQGAGLMSKATTGGTTTLNMVEAQSNAIETTGALGSGATVNVPAGFPGLSFDLFNNNTGAFTTTFAVTGGSGFTVAQGKRARGYVNASGNLVRVSADT